MLYNLTHALAVIVDWEFKYETFRLCVVWLCVYVANLLADNSPELKKKNSSLASRVPANIVFLVNINNTIYYYAKILSVDYYRVRWIRPLTIFGLLFPVACSIFAFDKTLAEQLYCDKRSEFSSSVPITFPITSVMGKLLHNYATNT